MQDNNKNGLPEDKVENMLIHLPENLKAAAFCNSASAQFEPEAISIDFMNLGALSSSVVARVVLTPSHTKRLINLLSEKVDEYEKIFGEVPVLVEPKV